MIVADPTQGHRYSPSVGGFPFGLFDSVAGCGLLFPPSLSPACEPESSRGRAEQEEGSRLWDGARLAVKEIIHRDDVDRATLGRPQRSIAADDPDLADPLAWEGDPEEREAAVGRGDKERTP